MVEPRRASYCPGLLGLSEDAWVKEYAKNSPLIERALTLSEVETWKQSRHGAWQGIQGIADITLLGIGLSRTGAAGSMWSDRIAADRYITPDSSFSDNIFRAIFTELGLFGALSYLVLYWWLSINFLA